MTSYKLVDLITFVEERVASNLEMGLQSHQKAETKVSVPSRKNYKDFITFVEERVALSLEMGLQSHQKAETKVSVPNKNTISSYKDRINNIIGQEKVYARDGLAFITKQRKL